MFLNVVIVQALTHCADCIPTISTIVHWRPQKLSAEGARIELGMGWGWEVPFPNRPTGPGGAYWWAPPAGSGAEPRPKTYCWHIWGPQNTPGRENSVTLLNNVQSPKCQRSHFFSVKNQLNRRLGTWYPLSPLATPLRLSHFHLLLLVIQWGYHCDNFLVDCCIFLTFPSVLWHCWYGHMTCKNRPWYDQ